MNGDSGVEMNADEVRALANSLVAERLRSTGLWLEWEELPALSERSFDRVFTAVTIIADQHRLIAEAWAGDNVELDEIVRRAREVVEDD